MSNSKVFSLPDTFSYDSWTIRYVKLMPLPDVVRQKPSVTTVVFVHGTPWSSDVFRPVAEALLGTQRYEIILYDLLGYEQSQTFGTRLDSDPEPDTSVKAQGEALSALLEHLRIDGKGGNKRAHVIAHDIAGVIALRAHLLHDCEYQSLCLMDTNCVLPWGDKMYNLVRSYPQVFEEMPAGVFEGCLRAIIQSARFHGRGLSEKWWEDILARPWLADASTNYASSGSSAHPQANFVRQIKQANDRHTAELFEPNLYSKVRCGVKIMWGEADQWIPKEKMDKLAEMLGGNTREFVAIPDASHLIMLDQPERVTLEIGRWLENQG